MIRRPPRSTRTDTLFPYTTLFRSAQRRLPHHLGEAAGGGAAHEIHLPQALLGMDEAERAVEVVLVGRLDPHHAVTVAAHGDRCFQRRDANLARRFRQGTAHRSEEHTSELQSLMRISYAVFCLKKKKNEN